MVNGLRRRLLVFSLVRFHAAQRPRRSSARRAAWPGRGRLVWRFAQKKGGAAQKRGYSPKRTPHRQEAGKGTSGAGTRGLPGGRPRRPGRLPWRRASLGLATGVASPGDWRRFGRRPASPWKATGVAFAGDRGRLGVRRPSPDEANAGAGASGRAEGKGGAGCAVFAALPGGVLASAGERVICLSLWKWSCAIPQACSRATT